MWLTDTEQCQVILDIVVMFLDPRARGTYIKTINLAKMLSIYRTNRDHHQDMVQNWQEQKSFLKSLHLEDLVLESSNLSIMQSELNKLSMAAIKNHLSPADKGTIVNQHKQDKDKV